MTSGMALYQQLAQMRVQGRPLLELDGKPPRIDAECHNTLSQEREIRPTEHVDTMTLFVNIITAPLPFPPLRRMLSSAYRRSALLYISGPMKR